MPAGLLLLVFISVTLAVAAVLMLLTGRGSDSIRQRALRRLGAAADGAAAQAPSPASLLKKGVLDAHRRRKSLVAARLDG